MVKLLEKLLQEGIDAVDRPQDGQGIECVEESEIINNVVDNLYFSYAQNVLPPVYVIDQHIPTALLPNLYHEMDCVVIPSRGEGHIGSHASVVN